MTKLVDVPRDLYKNKLNHGFHDGFDAPVITADRWTISTDQDGTAAQHATIPSLMSMMTGAVTAALEWELVVTTGITVLPAINKPFVFGARVAVVESNTNDAGVVVGMSDIILETLIADTTGLPAAGANYATFFYKKPNDADLDNVWRIHQQSNVTNVDVPLTAANSLDGAAHVSTTAVFQWLELHGTPTTAALMDVEWYVDGVLVYKQTDAPYTADKPMKIIFIVKDLAATNEDFLNVDDCYYYQTK